MKTLTLSPQEIQLMLTCLSKQPYEAVAGLIAKISQQVATPEKPQEPPCPLDQST